MFSLRPYQLEAVNKGIKFFETEEKKYSVPSLCVLPTGSGKSLVIANIAKNAQGKVLVFQPSKEILEQNYNKLISYGVEDVAIYSASAGSKEIGQVTYATIGSVARKPYLFDDVEYVIIDEAHLVNPAEGQYKAFISMIQPKKVLGLTATPYRLKSYQWEEDRYSKLMMLTRTKPNFWKRIIHVTQIDAIKEYLCPLVYRSADIDQTGLKTNTTGADYNEESYTRYYENAGIHEKTVNAVHEALSEGRKHILAFCRSIGEAERLRADLVNSGVTSALVTGKTPKKGREGLLKAFMEGEIQVMVNVGVLTTGFDFPQLDCIINTRNTMSLALWYQIVGRALRTHPDKKDALIYDLSNSYKRFGPVEALQVVWTDKAYQVINNARKEITGVRLDSLQ